MQRIACFVVLYFIAHATSADAPARTIYRCETPTGITFADRPCGPASQPYEPNLDAVSVVSVVAPPVTRPTRPAPSPRVARAVDAIDRKAQACARIERALDRIASTFRTGYTARQGERLKQRKRDLEEQRHAQHC